jgi:NifB/MoaA-like Fe-S oxidoreductase
MSMLRAEGDLFIDDLMIDDIEKSLSVPVVPVPVNGKELLNAVLK